MLSSITEQFREDNLPIDFEHAEPEQGVNPDSDDRFLTRPGGRRFATTPVIYFQPCRC